MAVRWSLFGCGLGGGRQRRQPLDRVNSFGQPGEHGRLVPAAGADLEDAAEVIERNTALQTRLVEDLQELTGYLQEYCADFGIDCAEVLGERFVKVLPKSTRPYGNMYCAMPR